MQAVIDPSEKKVALIAILTSAAHLVLIAYAALSLGLTVPTCRSDLETFTQAGFEKIGDKRYEVHYLAKMWAFEPKVIRLPVGATVDFFLTSQDVNHGFHIHDTNVNLMAVPSVVNTAQHTFTRPGVYPVVCHEYCGVGHQNMSATIVVDASLTDAEVEGLPRKLPEGLPVAEAGDNGAAQLFKTKGCSGCHSVDGSPGAGPSLKGLFAKAESLADGSSVTVDEAYLRESIREPPKRLVKGYPPIMPPLPVTDEELTLLVKYIKTIQ